MKARIAYPCCGKYGEIRIFEGDATWGEPYVWCCGFRIVEGNVAEIRLAQTGPPSGGREAIREALNADGITRCRWLRSKDGMRERRYRRDER